MNPAITADQLALADGAEASHELHEALNRIKHWAATNAEVVAFYRELGYSLEERISMGKVL